MDKIRIRGGRPLSGEIVIGGAKNAGLPLMAAGLLTEALTGFLADKLGEPASGLTMRRVVELMQMRQPQVPEQALERIRALWEDLDSRRFAPPAAGSAGDGAAARQELTDLLHSLEKELKR